MEKILVIDIGGSSVKTAKFTFDGKLIDKSSFAVPLTYDLMLKEIINLFEQDNYTALSISSPGSIDSVSGIGYGLSAIDYIPCGGNLKHDLEIKLNIPVAIENDANCAGLSEVYFSDDLDSIAYIVLGSGVGGCMIIDNKVVTGSTFFGGEFGYIPYKDGTYSTYAGMIELSKRATGAEQVISGIEIFEKYDSGEEKYVHAVNEYYAALAHLISVLKFTQNPQAIIFSGAITNRKLFLNEVKVAMEKISSHSSYHDITDVNILVSKFGADANLYGAYANLKLNYNI